MAVLNKIFTSRDEVDKSQLDLNMALTVKLLQQFPDLLEDVMAKIVPRLDMIKAANFRARLPWNRRERRRLRTAKNIVIHLFPGPDQSYWDRHCSSSTTEVCARVDTTTATPVNSTTRMFRFPVLMSLCARGRALLDGPPWRTR